MPRNNAQIDLFVIITYLACFGMVVVNAFDSEMCPANSAQCTTMSANGNEFALFLYENAFPNASFVLSVFSWLLTNCSHTGLSAALGNGSGNQYNGYVAPIQSFPGGWFTEMQAQALDNTDIFNPPVPDEVWSCMHATLDPLTPKILSIVDVVGFILVCGVSCLGLCVLSVGALTYYFDLQRNRQNPTCEEAIERARSGLQRQSPSAENITLYGATSSSRPLLDTSSYEFDSQSL